MFTGSVPKPVVEQILAASTVRNWSDAFVCCSGSFRVDGAIARHYDGAVRVHSNDVSLLSVGIGKLLVGEAVDIRFIGRLEFLEPLLEGAPFERRVAGVAYALELAKYAGKSDHAKAHFAHFVGRAEEMLDRAQKKIGDICAATPVSSFFAGDFLKHADRAAEIPGAGVVAFPPTYKGGYERIYKFINENTAWEAPAYGVWNPADIGDWMTSLEERGIPYCIFSDQAFPDRRRIAEYYSNTNKPVMVYASEGGASLRRAEHGVDQFAYTPIDAARIHKGSRVQIIRASGRQMNFVKDVYLAKTIHHTTGQFNFLVLIDGMLAGGFILSKSKFGSMTDLYMLSDFSLTRERRVSKLIPMLALSREVIAAIERVMMVRLGMIFTTAFTDAPVSMKYRGIYELHKRGEGFLQYKAAVTGLSAQDTFREWFRKHGSKAGALPNMGNCPKMRHRR